jgi:hypothetical protein
MWTCPKCRQKVDDAYEVCWACGTSVDGVEDPHFFDEPEQGPEAPPVPPNLVTVAKYLSGPEAHAMRSQLEAEGIQAFLFDEMSTTVGLLSSTASGGVKVLVPDECLQRAREILGIPEEEEEPPEPPAAEEQDLDVTADDSDEPPDEGIMDPERT